MAAAGLENALPARLSPAKKLGLAAEIIASYARVRLVLRSHPLPEAVARLRAGGEQRGGRDPADGYRLTRAVVRTLEPLPVDSRCLMLSLVLLRMLAKRGLGGSLVIAVRGGADIGLDAHAWVELDGRPLLAPATPDYGHLLTL